MKMGFGSALSWEVYASSWVPPKMYFIFQYNVLKEFVCVTYIRTRMYSTLIGTHIINFVLTTFINRIIVSIIVIVLYWTMFAIWMHWNDLVSV